MASTQVFELTTLFLSQSCKHPESQFFGTQHLCLGCGTPTPSGSLGADGGPRPGPMDDPKAWVVR